MTSILVLFNIKWFNYLSYISLHIMAELLLEACKNSDVFVNLKDCDQLQLEWPAKKPVKWKQVKITNMICQRLQILPVGNFEYCFLHWMRWVCKYQPSCALMSQLKFVCEVAPIYSEIRILLNYISNDKLKMYISYPWIFLIFSYDSFKVLAKVGDLGNDIETSSR